MATIDFRYTLTYDAFVQIRSFTLSKIEMGEFTIAGYSVAGEESVLIAPELDVCFDIGKCPREALAMNNVLLTHGHADHSAGILYYFAQRDFQGIADGKVLLPANLVDPMHDLLRAWGRLEGHVPPYEVVGLKAGEDYPIRRGLIARTFATRHVRGSLGYSIIEVRQKLKAKYSDLTGPELVALKKKSVEISRQVEMPLIAYLGDTTKSDYAKYPCVRDARALVIECTFFELDHSDRANAGRHIHIDDLPGILEGMNNEKIIITHLTRRTNMALARKVLKSKLPPEVLKKTTFLMSRKYVANATNSS